MSWDAETISGLIALVALACSFTALVVLHVLPTGMSPLHNAVSQYGITSYRAGYRIQTVAMAACGFALAVGVSRLDVPGCRFVTGFLIIFGLTRLLISWFPMDEPGTTTTTTGRKHGLLAIGAFVSATVAAVHLGDTLVANQVWGDAGKAVFGIGIALIVLLVGMFIVTRAAGLRTYFGLVERGFYLAMIGFLAVVASELLRAH